MTCVFFTGACVGAHGYLVPEPGRGAEGCEGRCRRELMADDGRDAGAEVGRCKDLDPGCEPVPEEVCCEIQAQRAWANGSKSRDSRP